MDRTLSRRIGAMLIALALALATSSVVMWMVLSRHAPSGSASALPEGGDFVLQSAAGPVDSRAFRGQVILLYFGYTFCPDICPSTLSDMGKAIRSLSAEEQALVRGVFVSVDPERDSLARLHEYAAYFDPRITGASGDEQELMSLLSRYGATYRRVPLEDSEGYAVEHPGSVYVLDARGQLRGRITHGSTQPEWQRAIRGALADG
jgi:protein SCO1/2